MVSRRRFLSAVGSVGAAGLGGCLTRAGVAETGFLSYKGIEVTWESRGRLVSADLFWAWSDGRERIFGWIAHEYRSLVRSPTDIRMSEAGYERLQDEFVDVTFELGFSRIGATDHDLLGGDWYTARAPRREFNAVQFGDRAEVMFDFPRVRVVDVYDGAQGDPDGWMQELGTMDFEGTHRGDRDPTPVERAASDTGRYEVRSSPPSRRRARAEASHA